MANRWLKKSRLTKIDEPAFREHFRYRDLLNLRAWLACLMLILAGSGCAPQRNLGRQFVAEAAQTHVLILAPQDILKSYFPIHPDSLQYHPIQDFPLEDSEFLYETNDSLLIHVYMESLLEELQRFNLQVYTLEQIDDFFRLDANAHIFSVAQVELMEYPDEMIDQVMVDTVLYEARVDINTLVINSWFEYALPRDAAYVLEVLFSMQYRSDFVEGRFRRSWLTGEISYQYQPYRLILDDIYDLAWEAGRQNAQYIFDFLLNEYIRENLSRAPDDFYYYDRQRDVLQRTHDLGFVRLLQSEQAPDQE